MHACVVCVVRANRPPAHARGGRVVLRGGALAAHWPGGGRLTGLCFGCSMARGGGDCLAGQRPGCSLAWGGGSRRAAPWPLNGAGWGGRLSCGAAPWLLSGAGLTGRVDHACRAGWVFGPVLEVGYVWLAWDVQRSVV
eukprot:355731-Chlamydomonas_euryale.AAC.8